MSRLAKKPIKLPEGVTASVDGDFLVVKGTQGEGRVMIPSAGAVKIAGDEIRVAAAGKEEAGAWVGTLWSLIKNAVEGSFKGFTIVLEIEGVGYRVVLEGRELVFFLGYAEPVRFKLTDGITAKVEKSAIILSGINKDLIGRTAAEIRSLKKPEPYKGKGIHYKGEIIKRKIGKKAAATTGAK